jgi:hypothetical protein
MTWSMGATVEDIVCERAGKRLDILKYEMVIFL